MTDIKHNLGPGWDRVQADIERRETTARAFSDALLSDEIKTAHRRGFLEGVASAAVVALILAAAFCTGCTTPDDEITPPPAWTWHTPHPMAFDVGPDPLLWFAVTGAASSWREFSLMTPTRDYATGSTVLVMFEDLGGLRDAEARAWQRADGRWEYELAIDTFAAGNGARVYPAVTFELGRLLGLWEPEGQGNGSFMDHPPTRSAPALVPLPTWTDGRLLNQAWGYPSYVVEVE